MKKLFLLIITALCYTIQNNCLNSPELENSAKINHTQSDKTYSMTPAEELVYIDNLYKKHVTYIPLNSDEITYLTNLYNNRIFKPTHISYFDVIIDLIDKRKKKLLNIFHKEYEKDHLFCKRCNMKAIEIAISLLEKNIRNKKQELLPENIRTTKKLFITIGCIPIGIFVILGISIAYKIYKIHNQFISGRFFNHINISSALFKELSSKRFTLSEKRNLRQFNVQKITIDREIPINTLSARDKEKLTYIALDYATKKHWSNLKKDIKSMIITTFLKKELLIAGILSSLSFLIAFMDPYWTADSLKKDQKLLNALQEEQASRLSFNTKSI